MKVSAEHDIHVFRVHTGRHHTIDIGRIYMMKMRHRRSLTPVPGARIDQNYQTPSSNDPALKDKLEVGNAIFGEQQLYRYVQPRFFDAQQFVCVFCQYATLQAQDGTQLKQASATIAGRLNIQVPRNGFPPHR